jgi:hypothetical protein
MNMKKKSLLALIAAQEQRIAALEMHAGLQAPEPRTLSPWVVDDLGSVSRCWTSHQGLKAAEGHDDSCDWYVWTPDRHQGAVNADVGLAPDGCDSAAWMRAWLRRVMDTRLMAMPGVVEPDDGWAREPVVYGPWREASRAEGSTRRGAHRWIRDNSWSALKSYFRADQRARQDERRLAHGSHVFLTGGAYVEPAAPPAFGTWIEATLVGTPTRVTGRYAGTQRGERSHCLNVKGKLRRVHLNAPGVKSWRALTDDEIPE